MGLKSFWNSLTGKADDFIQTAVDYLGNYVIPLRENSTVYIKDGYQKNLWVNLAINYIVNRASDVPWRLYRKDSQGEEVEVEKHWALDLIKKPNPLQSNKHFIQQSLGFYLLTGNTFFFKQTPGIGQNANVPKRLWVLPTPYIEITTGKSYKAPVTGYRLNLIDQAEFKPEEIIHLKSPSYDWENNQHYYGTSPLKAALSTINLSNSTTKAMTAQAQNGGALGLLMYDAQANGNKTLTTDQMKAVKQRINLAVNGEDKRNKIVGAAQLFQWVQLGMKAADLQLLQDHDLTRDDILSIYNLSSTLFNSKEASTESNVKEMRKAAWTDAILPRLNDLVDSVNSGLLENEDVYFKLDYSHISELKPDLGKLIADLKDAYWIPTSEKQRMTNIEPDGVLPEYLVPIGLISANAEDMQGAEGQKVLEGERRYGY